MTGRLVWFTPGRPRMRDLRQSSHLFDVPPLFEARGGIRAEDQREVGLGRPLGQGSQRVHGIAWSRPPQFAILDGERRVVARWPGSAWRADPPGRPNTGP